MSNRSESLKKYWKEQKKRSKQKGFPLRSARAKQRFLIRVVNLETKASANFRLTPNKKFDSLLQHSVMIDKHGEKYGKNEVVDVAERISYFIKIKMKGLIK